MKKVIPIAALAGLLFVIGFVSISVRNNNIAFAAPPCSSCQKTADSGKKQSTSKKICSAITGILTNEIGKTKNKTKLDILKGGLGYANDVCDSGGAPDLAKITKGLSEKDKARISQKTNAALFDGAAELPDKDFGPATSNTAATLTGGGQIADLKLSEPDLTKTSPITEFSLASKSTTLLASAKTAVALTAKASVASPCPPNEQLMDCRCPFENKGFGPKCSIDCYNTIDAQCSTIGGIGLGTLTEAWNKFLKDVKTVATYPVELAKELLTKLLRGAKEALTAGWKWFWHDLKEVVKEFSDFSQGVVWEIRQLFNNKDATVVCDKKGGFQVQLNFAQGAPCGIRECAQLHEQLHIGDIKAAYPKMVCVGAGFQPLFDNTFLNYTECRAHSTEITCLNNKLSQDLSSYCREAVTKRRDIVRNNKQSYCP